MSVWRAKWAREAQEAEEQRPLMKVSCQLCDYVGLSANPESMKVAHHAEFHFGRAMAFNVVRWEKAEGAKQ